MNFQYNPGVVHPKKRILVLEDVLSCQADLSRALARMFPEPHEVLCAFVQDARSAAAWIEANLVPDLVILDHDMPVGTGSEFLHWLSEQGIHNLPVVTASGIPINNDTMACLYPVIKHSKDDVIRGRADQEIREALGYPKKTGLSVAVVWGHHRNDPRFHTHHSYWEAAVENLGHRMTRYLWSEMADIPRSHDLYLFVDFHPALYALPKGHFRNSAFVWWDSHHTSMAVVLQVCENFDRCYFFEYTSSILSRSYGLPVTWLPPAYNAQVFRPLGKPKIHDYVFIGQRDQWVYRQGDSKESFIMKLAGAHGLHGYVGQGVYAEDANGIYNDGKVLFERTIFPSVGTRFFEIMGSGGFVLMNRLRPYSGIEILAQEGVHYATFDDSYEDFEKKLRYWAREDELREKIAAQGHRHFLENHTYDHRLKRILSDFDLGG